jgi:hypothetical protein
MAFANESNKLFVHRYLSAKDIAPWVKAQSYGSQPATNIVIHHTWSPTQAQWRGWSTFDGVYNYYRNQLGWPAGVGPHFFVAADGVYVGTHPAWDGIHAAGANHRTIGIETVGNFDLAPTYDPTLSHLRTLVQALGEMLHIPMQWNNSKSGTVCGVGLSGHRDWAYINAASNKSCPGSKNTKAYLLQEMQRKVNPVTPDPVKPTLGNDWTPEAEFLRQLGLAQGMTEGNKINFHPEQSMTRGQMATMFKRIIEFSDKRYQKV